MDNVQENLAALQINNNNVKKDADNNNSTQIRLTATPEVNLVGVSRIIWLNISNEILFLTMMLVLIESFEHPR